MIFFEFAQRNIRLHWLRSLLAVIGIVIGVVAISSMGILGNSLVLSVSESLTSVGDTLVVSPHTGGGGFGTGTSTQNTITDRQMEEITRAVAPNQVIPILSGGDQITVGNKNGYAMIYGMRPEDVPVMLEKDAGIYPRGASGVMIGSRLADEFDLSVGSRIGMGSEGRNVRVAGILKERGVGFDINPDFAIVVSDRWFYDTYGGEGWDQVIVKVQNLDDITPMKQAIENQLNRRDDVVDVYDTRSILETILTAFAQISTFTMAIGGISLIVAGVSILNVMMMSVTERTKEIGVLRSIGTRRGDVLRMFVYESFLLGLVGSLIGGLLSFAGGYLALSVMIQNASYLFYPSSLVQIMYGMTFGVATSVISGFYPAWKASNLNPIDALRHE